MYNNKTYKEKETLNENKRLKDENTIKKKTKVRPTAQFGGQSITNEYLSLRN